MNIRLEINNNLINMGSKTEIHGGGGPDPIHVLDGCTGSIRTRIPGLIVDHSRHGRIITGEGIKHLCLKTERGTKLCRNNPSPSQIDFGDGTEIRVETTSDGNYVIKRIG